MSTAGTLNPSMVDSQQMSSRKPHSSTSLRSPVILYRISVKDQLQANALSWDSYWHTGDIPSRIRDILSRTDACTVTMR